MKPKRAIFFLIILFPVALMAGSPALSQASISVNASCLPLGCTNFGGPILSFVTVPFCGQVITIGPPRPITAIYVGQKYLYPAIPTLPLGPATPGSQYALGTVNNFNPNLLCPLPIVTTIGVSKYNPTGL